ncbi:trimeric intracellular cation channel family protein [Catenulispora pinisilvae]|uniref:trimeric intracellular cation channel family protein n=1 Tax=Catenulispora pinisilvae TaxID=2705253 RepID=UPI0018925184|nr:TRIC cation channel family protein [Catenulispora pinisilvae]
MVANPHLPVLLDLLGVFAAAVAGAFAGLRKGLDLVGILVIAVASSLGGGMIRDALIGATPVAAISDWRYFAVALGATAAVLSVTNRRMSDSKLKSAIEEVRGRAVRFDRIALVADALTLGLFAVSGTLKALNYHLPVFQAALLGTVTATGGGAVRDVLVNEVPMVLQRELYAVPAFVGGLLFALLERHGFVVQGYLAAAGSVVITAAIRLIAVWRDWHAPRPGAVA